MTLQEMLADAQQKLHLLQTGRLAVEIIADGYVVKYNRAQIPQLMAYISNLQAQIAGAPMIGAINTIWSR
ncbi:gpW family head-tail joining protein [Methylocella tundrae]|uniref:Phage tail protein n=1 Tax=Methylocella tundrae TaxID=227605 RepID=A0A4U8YYM5_METTU|nr:gpW family head-tail joining protein [Methylocella tundrae]WPP05499.1 gpW family head-tail joining protein [Methylocella tundrae]VFU07924.1 protein of unknown function [Methylocella tundrae]